MTRNPVVETLSRPACLSVAAGAAALKDAARRARARWPREAARPSLTAAAPAAQGASGRGRKTTLQPNRKTLVGRHAGRTTHALQTADIFTRHRHFLLSGRCDCAETTGKPPQLFRNVREGATMEEATSC
jgi:hypothetical protein